MRTNANSEPSGIRLMRLIDTHILDIASREIDNPDRLRLYGTGGYWTAFDRSAFQLSRIFHDLDSFIVNPPGAPFTVVGLTVSEKDLKRYMKKNPALRQSVDYLEFAMETYGQEEYHIWHSKIIKGFISIINLSFASDF